MPSGNLRYKRGEIRWVKLDPTVGAEAKKTRAYLIVQNDTMNQYGLLTIVLRPGKKEAPYAVNVEASVSNGLDRERFLCTHNPKTDVVLAYSGRITAIAAGRATDRGIIRPRTTPRLTGFAMSSCYPSTAIGRRTSIVFMAVIGTPLPNIAVHIIEPEGIGRVTAHRSRFSTEHSD